MAAAPANLGGVLAQVDAALDALAAFDVESLQVGARGEALLALDVAHRRMEAQRLRALAVFDRSGDTALDGSTSTGAWVRWRTNSPAGRTNAQVRTSRKLDQLPTLTEAHRAGQVSGDHVAVVAKALDDSPERAETICRAEVMLSQDAQRLTPLELGRVVNRWIDAVDPGSALERAERQHRRRNLTASETFEGVLHLSGLLPPEGGAIVKTALDGLCQELYRAEQAEARAEAADEHANGKSGASADDLADLPPMTLPGQRRADALIELCRRYLNGGMAPRSGGARPHLSVLVPAETLEAAAVTAASPRAGRELLPLPGIAPAELDGIGPIPTATAQRLGCDCAVTVYGLDATGRPMSYGRTQRLVPPGLRRYLARRDGGCRFPGCDRPEAWTEAHHLKFWSQGGPTDAQNLALVCVAHHHALHEGGFSTRGDPEAGTLTFHRPDGTRLPDGECLGDGTVLPDGPADEAEPG